MTSVSCPSCGRPNDGGARFCSECGVALAAAPPPPPTQGAPAVAPPPGAPPPPPNRTPLIIAAAVLVAALALLGFVLLRDDGDSGSEEFVASTVSTSSTTASTTTSTTAAPPPAPAPAPAPDAVPSGLFCRDLDARGITYAEAVDYWVAEGSPDRMDADLNGFPCETVYPVADIIDYWGFDPQGGPGGAVLRGDLFCRDLDDLRFTYVEAVDYWFDNGSPDRMDADLDGVPCETVYPLADIIDYWGFDPS